MNRDEIAELAAGYALGALDAEDRARFEALLAAGDADAAAALRDFEGAVAGLAEETAETPSPAVKAALMARIDAQGRSRSRRSTWTIVLSGAMAAGIAAIAVGLVVSAAYDRRLTRLIQEQAALSQELDRQQSLVALLRDPATQVVTLSGLEAAPGAKARMLWHATAGGLLVAQALPPAPEGKAYELWAIAGKGAPQPAGVFTVDAKGVGSLRVAPMQAAGAVDTFAVTLEPAATSPRPPAPCTSPASSELRRQPQAPIRDRARPLARPRPLREHPAAAFRDAGSASLGQASLPGDRARIPPCGGRRPPRPAGPP